MALVKYKGAYSQVNVEGQVCLKGNSITVSSGTAASLLTQTADWEAGNKETEELGPPASPLPVPPVAAAKGVSIGAKLTPRVVNANFTTDGVLTKFKVKHGLATYNVTTSVQTHSGGNASEATTVSKIVAITAEEIEVTLSAAGASGVTYWVRIEG